jgi:hypothetical protein
MALLVALLGILWIIIGSLMVILTDAVREVMHTLLKQKNLDYRALSVLAIIIGAIFILSSGSVSVPWVIITLGILSIAKGLFFVFAPEKKAKALLDWWLGASSNLLKSWGVVVFLLGVLLLLII